MMKVRKINIYGYGKLQSVEIVISPEFQIFYGENEAGKTTIMSFLRHVLFGFPTKVQSERSYEPKTSSAYGGSLEVETAEHGVVVIERIKKSATGDVTVYFEDGSTGGEKELTGLLEGINKELYEAIFSFNIDGLQKLSQLREENLGDYLLSSSMTGTDVVRKVEARLEKEQEGLYKPSGKKPLINGQIQELRSVYDNYAKWQKQLKEYDALTEEKEEALTKLAQLEEERKSLQQDSKEIQLKQAVQPLLLEKQKYQAIQKSYEDSAEFPVDGIKRLDGIITQLQPLKLQYEAFREEEPSPINQQMESLGITNLPKIEVNYVVKEQCREYSQQFLVLQAQKEQIDQLFTAKKDVLEKSEHTIATLKDKRQKARPDNRSGRKATTNGLEKRIEQIRQFTPFFIFASLMMFIVGILLSQLPTIVSSLLLFVALVLLYMVTKQENQEMLTEEERKIQGMLELEELQLRQAEYDYEAVVRKYEDWEGSMRDLERNVTNLKRKIGLSGNIPIGQLSYIIEKIEQAQAEYKRTQQAIRKKQQIQRDIQLLQEECMQLFVKAGVREEEVFRIKGERKQQYEEAQKQVVLLTGQVQSIAPNELLQETDLHENYEMLLEEKEKSLVAQAAEERSLQGYLAEIQAKMKQMEEGSTYQSVIYDMEMKKAHLKDLIKRWGSVILAKELLRRTKEMYQEKRLPQIFQQAEKYFHYLTDGEYHTLFLPKDNQIQVERKDGQRFMAEELSRGTAEQLYLSLRLALASTYTRHPYPLILDDPLVNFDQQRASRAMKLLEEISKERQILFFTCHEHLVSLGEEVEIAHLSQDMVNR